MFQFPRLASAPLRGWRRCTPPGCPIRKSADQRSFASPRGLSQLITSFIASVSQGIRHSPFSVSYLTRTAYIFVNAMQLILSAVVFLSSSSEFEIVSSPHLPMRGVFALCSVRRDAASEAAHYPTLNSFCYSVCQHVKYRAAYASYKDARLSGE